MIKSTLSDLQTLTEKLAEKLSEPHDPGLDERIIAMLQKAIKDVFDHEISKVSDAQLELAATCAKVKELQKELETTKQEVIKLRESR